jgi:antitoxin YefM
VSHAVRNVRPFGIRRTIAQKVAPQFNFRGWHWPNNGRRLIFVGNTITELTMQAVTLKDAKRNLPRLVEQVLSDAEPRIVVTDKGEQVVVMPLDEFNSWKETLYLLANPSNAAHLRRSMAEAELGQAEKRELIAE